MNNSYFFDMFFKFIQTKYAMKKNLLQTAELQCVSFWPFLRLTLSGRMELSDPTKTDVGGGGFLSGV